MEIDEEIRRSLMQNLETSLKDITRHYRDAIDIISTAEDVEEIMVAKQDLLVACVDQMPMSVDECYFCLLQLKHLDGDWNFCKGCKYGEVHGKCRESSSVFYELTKMRNKFSDELVDKYYSGERYDKSGDVQA
jgi:hypothetical protein